jgi:rRNA processing protein Krr1/Pno1
MRYISVSDSLMRVLDEVESILRDFNASISVDEQAAMAEITVHGDNASELSIRQFIRAVNAGFSVKDAAQLLYIQDKTIFDIDVRENTRNMKECDRQIGRVIGKHGSVKEKIEKSTQTDVLITDKTVYILGTFRNCSEARDIVYSIIEGMPITQACRHMKRYSDIKQVVDDPHPNTRSQHENMFGNEY